MYGFQINLVGGFNNPEKGTKMTITCTFFGRTKTLVLREIKIVFLLSHWVGEKTSSLCPSLLPILKKIYIKNLFKNTLRIEATKTLVESTVGIEYWKLPNSERLKVPII